MIWVALAGLAVWLLVLTVLLVGVVRHVAEVHLAEEAGPTPRVLFDFSRSGPPVGSRLPTLVERLVGPNPNGRTRVLTFFSPTCGNCLERARDIVALGSLGVEAFFFVDSREPTPESVELVEILTATLGRVFEGDDVLPAMQEMNIEALPWIVSVGGDEVVDSSFLSRGTNLGQWYGAARDLEASNEA
ncbi:MAG: hypothetical protein QNL12_05780 [Acidimicrobiia bacterium]|nr:hypothetical protein [Acidimicrobiia bacterium]MDX2466804.1 hypothetical protein [Acidimicrobiia bacterium]